MILLYALKLCIKATLTNNNLDIEIDGHVRTLIQYGNISKIYPSEINYFIMNCESIHNVIVNYIAQSADINTTNKIYMNS